MLKMIQKMCNLESDSLIYTSNFDAWNKAYIMADFLGLRLQKEA